VEELKTKRGRRFRFKGRMGEEFIVYPSDKRNEPQDRYAVCITPFTVDLVLQAIRKKRTILAGASRDAPPAGSLGALVKEQKQSPQQLSYLIPILEHLGHCRTSFRGRAIVAHSVD